MMMKFITAVAGLALTASTAIAVTPVIPSSDPFYAAPDNLSAYDLGAIIRTRPVPNPLVDLTNIQTAIQVLYRTEDTSGSPEGAVTTIVVPNGADGTKLVSYQSPEDASFIGCAPSYTLQTSNSDGSLQAILNEGWVLNFPDYEGPDSAFTASLQSGQATLDSIRAALNSGDLTGIHSDAAVAMWGYSGGSLATGWAAQLQPQYAPDLHIVGAAVGGFIVNVTAVALNVNGGLYAGFVPAGIIGLSTQYPQLAGLANQLLNPSNASTFEQAADNCLTVDLVTYAFQDIFSYFQGGSSFLFDPEIQDILKQLTMGASAPTIPMFVYQGIPDQIAPVANVDETISAYCSEGASIAYFKDPDTDHVGTEEAGAPYALFFLQSVLNGMKPPSGCTTVTTAFAPVSTPPASNGTATATASGSANTTVISATNVTLTSSVPSGSAVNTNVQTAGASSLSVFSPLALLVLVAFVCL
jgi:hypothetical protein